MLRPYQSDAVPAIHAALMRVRGVLYVLPTGGGKTIVFSEICRLCHEYGTDVIVVVHRDTLLMQASDKLRAINVPHTLIAPGHTNFGDAIKVASVQTLARRIGSIGVEGKPLLFIIDEGHHGVSGSYKKIADAYPDASLLYVTATPRRRDGRGLGEVAQEMVLGPSIRTLMDDGYLCEAVTYGAAEVAGAERLRSTGGDYNVKDVEELMDRRQVTGDAIDHYRRICDGAPTIVFTATVRHAQDVAAQFREAGYRFEAIDGKMPTNVIRERLGGLADKSLHGIVSCELISEGFDAPAVVCGILLRQTKSLAVNMQQVGRLLRPDYADGFDLMTKAGRLAATAASSKPKAIILDHAGNSFRHGLPDEDREWSLEAGKKKEQAIALKTCPNCFGYSRTWDKACKACGHKYNVAARPREVDHVAGELVELDPTKMARLRASEEGMARTYAQLRELGQRRGHAPQWAYKKWIARGGDPAEAR